MINVINLTQNQVEKPRKCQPADGNRGRWQKRKVCDQSHRIPHLKTINVCTKLKWLQTVAFHHKGAKSLYVQSDRQRQSSDFNYSCRGGRWNILGKLIRIISRMCFIQLGLKQIAQSL